MAKHILVIQGSPTKGGNADMLADAFIEGVEAAGSTATKLTLADMDIAPFTGYDQPADDMTTVMEQMKAADGIVIATPTLPDDDPTGGFSATAARCRGKGAAGAAASTDTLMNRHSVRAIATWARAK